MSIRGNTHVRGAAGTALVSVGGGWQRSRWVAGRIVRDGLDGGEWDATQLGGADDPHLAVRAQAAFGTVNTRRNVSSSSRRPTRSTFPDFAAFTNAR